MERFAYQLSLHPQSDMSRCLAELFCVIRFSELDCEELDSIIEWGMTTHDPAVLRHCLGMLLSMAPDAPDRAAKLLQSVLTDSSVTAAISQDSLASVCYVKLCWALYKVRKDAAYLKVLCAVAQETAEAPSLLAMELLCQLPYDVLSAMGRDGASGNGGDIACLLSPVELLQFIAATVDQRCTSYAQNSDNLGLTTVCQIVTNLCKPLITHFGSRNAVSGSPAMEAIQQSLNSLYATLNPFSTSISIFLQTSVLKVMIWLMNPPQDEDSKTQYYELMRRTKAMTLPVSIAQEVLSQLVSRALSTPSFSHFAVEVSWAWFLQNPDTVTIDTLLGAWHACFALHDVVNCEYTLDVGEATECQK